MSFYFYDLETSGFNPRTSRIMQFGGVLTDENFIVQDEWVTLVRLTDEILPEPDAVLLTGITPQKTHQEGLSEAEFLREFSKRTLKRGVTILGFNNIRFDDEFMRFTMWRNFYDAYEWQWRDGRTRWDLLDVMRMTRALRPEGVKWPTEAGKPTNRLELLTKANKIEHGAHDALADAKATLALANLVRQKQPKLFDFLFETRKKAEVLKRISPDKPKPFVYSSGRYSSDFHKTTVAVVLAAHPSNPNGFLVYDLRCDPDSFDGWSTQQIAERAFMPYAQRQEANLDPFPVKVLQINKAPAVAPPGVLDKAAQQRIQLSLEDVEKHLKKLAAMPDFAKNVVAAWEEKSATFSVSSDPDDQLYDGFIPDDDRKRMRAIQSLSATEVAGFEPDYKDPRLQALWPRYLARNYPSRLTHDQREVWEQFRARRLTTAGSAMTFDQYFRRLQQLAQRSNLSSNEQFLIEELQLYGESIAPELELGSNADNA